jgi:hypothetical protein
MAVLLEMVSLVAPVEALRRIAGEPARVAATLGAVAACDDGALGAHHFDSSRAAWRALDWLEQAGLVAMRGEEPGDLAVVDQRRGPAGWWPWLELARLGEGDGHVLAARLRGDPRRALAAPVGWSHRGSASEAHGVGALRLVDRPLRHLGREPEGDRYLDPFAGEEVRLGRAHPPVRVVVEGPQGRGEVIAEVASHVDEVEVGLMFRERLAPGEGMLFRFDAPERHGFWMKNTLVPLDLLFVGGDGRVTNVAARAEPMTATHRWSSGPVRQVLEVAGGWCEAHGVGAGALVRVEPAR